VAISVKVKLNAILKEYSPVKGQSAFQLSLAESSRIEDVIRELKLPRHQVGLAAVNLKYTELSYTLRDGDEVILFPQLTGGWTA